jgi:hypothetical protein
LRDAEDRRANVVSVRARPLLAWSIYGGLTVPVGILTHLCYEGSGGVVGRFGSLEPDHALLFGIAAVWFAWSVRALRRGTGQDRRARLHGLNAALPRPSVLVGTTALVQAAVAAASLACEGVRVVPAHIAIAIAVASAVALLGALGFCALRYDVLRAAAGLAVQTPERGAGIGVTGRQRTLVFSRSSPTRLRRGRAPPSVATP